MSFDWVEYLSLAQGLCGLIISGPPAGAEAQQRAAVSRAYYAAFILARNQLRDVDGFTSPPRSNPHSFVATEYEQHVNPQRARIGTDLRRLRANRNRCDYDDVVAGLPRLTQRSLALAGQILVDLRQL